MTLRARLDGDRGTGVVGSLAAVVVFLSFLLLASHVLIALYARSTVSAAGYDAARQVASRTVDHTDPAATGAAQRRAEDRLRQLLGRMGDGADISWNVGTDSVSVRIRAEVPHLGVPGLARPPGLTSIDRSFTVRIEGLR